MPKYISPADPAARWTAADKGPAYFAYSTNYLIDLDHAVIVDVEATTAIRQAKVGAVRTMIERVDERHDLQPRRLAADTAYGSNGADLMGLVPYWSASLPDTVFMAPNAPEICPGAPGGYQWWSLSDLGRESRAAGVRQAAPLVNTFIDMHRNTYDLPNSKVALVGFSQGTMMALNVGPRRSEVLAGIVGYSGMLADADPPRAAQDHSARL